MISPALYTDTKLQIESYGTVIVCLRARHMTMPQSCREVAKLDSG